MRRIGGAVRVADGPVRRTRADRQPGRCAGVRGEAGRGQGGALSFEQTLPWQRKACNFLLSLLLLRRSHHCSQCQCEHHCSQLLGLSRDEGPREQAERHSERGREACGHVFLYLFYGYNNGSCVCWGGLDSRIGGLGSVRAGPRARPRSRARKRAQALKGRTRRPRAVCLGGHTRYYPGTRVLEYSMSVIIDSIP